MREQEQSAAPHTTLSASEQRTGLGSPVWRAFIAPWRWLSDLMLILRPCRFSVLVVLITAVLLIDVPQCQEALRALAERNEYPELLWQQWVWFFVAASLLALNAWYWARQMLNIEVPNAPPSTPRQERMRRYVPRVCGAAALLSITVALALARNAYHLNQADAVVPRRLLLWAVWTAAALTVLFYVFVQIRRQVFKLAPQFKVTTLKDFSPRTWWLLAASALLAFAFFLAFWFAPLHMAPRLGAPSIVLFAAATWIPLGSFCVYLGSRYEVPVLRLLCVALLVFSLWNDNHRVQVLSTTNATPITTRVSLDDAAHAWLQVRQTEIAAAKAQQQVYPVFVVAAAGGGIRAAYWTATLLSGLEDRYPGEFARHTFGISGVSGGSLGSAMFVGLLAERQAGRISACWRNECGTPLRPWANAVMSQDFLAPVLGGMLYTDLTQRFLPFAVPAFDRARVLEGSWEKAWRDQGLRGDRMAEPFNALWRDDINKELPLLFLNSTVVESGRRAIISPVAIDNSFHDALDAATAIDGPIALSTAAHLSARFTYVSPAAAVYGRDAAGGEQLSLHLVDGGYFENAGLSTALEIADAFHHAAAAQQLSDGICVKILVISNEPGYIANGVSREGKPARFFTEARAPVTALFATRDARSRFAEAEVQSHHQGILLGLEQRSHRAGLPLGWMLSDVAQHEIDAQLKHALADGEAATVGRVLSSGRCD